MFIRAHFKCMQLAHSYAACPIAQCFPLVHGIVSHFGFAFDENLQTKCSMLFIVNMLGCCERQLVE